MTPREAILAEINHEEIHPVPYTFGCEKPELSKKLEEHYGSEVWKNKFTQYFAGVAGIDTVREERISDTHTRDAFGGIWRQDRLPPHLEEPAMKEPSFENYEFPNAELFRNPDMAKAARRVRDGDFANVFTTIGCGWGLFEQSWRIRGFQNALMDSVAEPDFYAELLDRLTDLFLFHVEQSADVPADAIMFGDDWGDQRGIILGPERWRKFLKPRLAKIYDAVHAQGKFVISHCCGSIADIMPDVIEIGLDVYESVQPEPAGMNPYGLKKKWGDKITFWGALGSQSTIQFGTPQEIRAEIKHLCSEMGKGGGYILAPAKSLQPGTSLENAIAVVDGFTNQDA